MSSALLLVESVLKIALYTWPGIKISNKRTEKFHRFVWGFFSFICVQFYSPRHRALKSWIPLKFCYLRSKIITSIPSFFNNDLNANQQSVWSDQVSWKYQWLECFQNISELFSFWTQNAASCNSKNAASVDST